MKSAFKFFSIVLLLSTLLSCDKSNEAVASYDPVEIEGYLLEQLQNVLPDKYDFFWVR